MKIAIITATTTDKITGVAEYLINLIQNLQSIDANNQYYIVTTKDNSYMFDITNPNFLEIVLPIRQKPWLVMRLLYHAWQNIYLPLWCKVKRIDLVHLPNTLFASPFMDSVVTIHDITELKTRKYSQLRTLIRKMMILTAIHFSRRVISDSDSTTRDLNAMGANNAITIHLGFDDTYSGHDFDAAQEDRILNDYKVEKNKYVICIGTIMKHKNIPNIIQAFGRIPEHVGNYKLLVVGAHDNAYQDVVAAIADNELSSKVSLLDYVDSQEKRVLLRNAKLSCLISSYEGFGLPVLESQAAGVPVLISNVSALPEVAGEGALSVDPNDIAAISDKMLSCLTDDELRASLIARGRENISRFSWRRCAIETLQVYENARDPQ